MPSSLAAAIVAIINAMATQHNSFVFISTTIHYYELSWGWYQAFRGFLHPFEIALYSLFMETLVEDAYLKPII